MEAVNAAWLYEDKHRQLYTDLFMFSGEERFHVVLQLGILSRNLLLEEYPQSADNIHEEDDRYWRFETDVASYLGIGRFVLGLYDDIAVIADEGFKNYIQDKIRKMYGG